MKPLYYFIAVGCFCVVVTKCNPPTCTTPNGETAVCVSLFSCPVLQKAVASEDPIVQKFVRDSDCGGQFMICCGTSGNFTQSPNKPEIENRYQQQNTTEESRKDFVLARLLPKKSYCGMQHTDDYFYNETATSVDEFPWMMYVPLKQHSRSADPKVEIKCAGVLISNQFALTAAYCASLYLTSVRIGQYHRDQNISCIKTSFGEDDCTEPVIEVEIASKYRLSRGNLLLMKLAKKITYSDFVRPICLPLEDSDRPKTGDTIVTSGWGEETYGGETVKIKKRVKHTLESGKQCETSDDFFQTSDICAITLENSSSYLCSGDDGGPFMYKHKNNWFVEGIIMTNLKCPKDEPVRGERINPETMDELFEIMYAMYP